MQIPSWLQNFVPVVLGDFSLSQAITDASPGDFYGAPEPDVDASLEDAGAPSTTAAGAMDGTEELSASEKEDGECSSEEDHECSDAGDGGDTPQLNTNGKRSRNAVKMATRRFKRRGNPRPSGPQLRHLRSTDVSQPTMFDSVNAPHTKNGYVGTTHNTHIPDGLPDLDTPLPEGDGTVHPLIPHLQAKYGFSLRSIPPGERTTAFQSGDNQKIFLLRTRPADSSWHGRAGVAVEALFKALRLPASAALHRRGCFFTDKYGYSHGNGRTVPGNWATTEGRVKAWQDFLVAPAILNMMNYLAALSPSTSDLPPSAAGTVTFSTLSLVGV
ncbi:hypothetical protein FRC00_002251 [Tulasnella sp. 408]|nr:hypothetical protein FRC00_002251 [Tulasnella sp. 408]